MANMRNKWEFYGSILEALGVDYTDAELKNNETLRAKLLEGLGVEHTYDDVNQYPLWREKLVEGVGNMSGGGGSSDFSTAEVTITWNNSKLGELLWDSCPTIVSDSMITGVMYTNISPAIITVPLYKGKCYWEKTTRGLTLSGNIEEYNDGDGMLITGDGTITIS